MTTDISGLIVSALTAERNSLTDFVTLLEREQNALVENDTDLLMQLAEQKSARAISLSHLINTRHHLLKSTLGELKTDKLLAWLQTHCTQGLTLWQEITRLGEKARQLNQSSGELIQLKLRHNQLAMTVLNNAANKANLYGPDGQPNLSITGQGRTLGSV